MMPPPANCLHTSFSLTFLPLTNACEGFFIGELGTGLSRSCFIDIVIEGCIQTWLDEYRRRHKVLLVSDEMSCVKKGYMKDDYIPHISVRKTFRRSPFINLRLLCLLAVIWKLLYQFVDVEKKSDEDAPVKKQILSLGAGFYTTYFQLQFFPDLPSPLTLSIYFMVGSLFRSCSQKILSVNTLLFRIERMELFDEFEEWYMMQASQLLINVLLIVCYEKCLNSVALNCWGPEWGDLGQS
ncbi:hypothetical protein VNO80_07896 [Phaseolus coccineus]|uniref:Uncharacterized protein n=1 Tax=Phaseolus coccineus TaxID=3886 RepID=A0AAN9RIW8_PHACN